MRRNAVIPDNVNSNPGSILLSDLKVIVDSFPGPRRKELIAMIGSVLGTLQSTFHEMEKDELA